MKPIPSDAKHQQVFFPETTQTASAVGNHDVDVIATTSLILYFEETSNNLSKPYYEPNEVSVGTHVQVDHLAAAIPGCPITVSATLSKQQGRRLEYSLTAMQKDTLIMSGIHHRAVVHRNRFKHAENSISHDESTQGSQETIEFWFDFHSPWCYIASHRIGDIASRFNLKIHWKPVHLANLNQAIDGRQPLEANRNFVAWYEQDMIDFTDLYKLPCAPHKEYPKRPSRALRASIYASDQNLAEPFVKYIMKGYWSEQKDISDLGFLAEAARQACLDESEIVDSTSDERYKSRLNVNLKQAIEKRLFGLPVTVYNNKIYWGNDRLDLLACHLKQL